MAIHYSNDSATGEYLIISADLRHDESGVSVEFRDGLMTVDGVVRVRGLPNVAELLEDAA